MIPRLRQGHLYQSAGLELGGGNTSRPGFCGKGLGRGLAEANIRGEPNWLRAHAGGHFASADERSDRALSLARIQRDRT